MIGSRWQPRLALTLIVGVVCMHALVVLGAGPTTTGLGAHSGAVPAPTAAAAGPGAALQLAPVSEARAAPPTAHDANASDLGPGSIPSAMHQVLHLCLAILAALLTVGVAALALRHVLRPDRFDARIGALIRRAHRRRPPPTSVRLAQLCILRN